MSNEELQDINGGAIKIGIIGTISAIISFIFGFIEGLSNPIGCGK